MDQQGLDGDQFARSLEECAGLFEEAVVIKRYTGESGGDDAAGTAAAPTYTSINTKANITEVTAREVGAGAGILALGDLKAEFRIPIYGRETYAGDHQASGRRPDLVTYRNREYFIVGHVFKTHLASTTHYTATLRQQQ